MANYGITSTALENVSFSALVAAVEAYLETLDSTNDPVVSVDFVYNSKNGTYHAAVITS